MRTKRATVYAVDYQRREYAGHSTCHVVAATPREARAIAAIMHPGTRILEARREPLRVG